MFTVTTVIAQYLVPLGLIAWMAFRQHRSRAGWALATVFVTIYLLTIALAGVWPVHPWLVPAAYATALLPVVTWSLRGPRSEAPWPTTRDAWLTIAMRGSLCIVLAVLAANAVSGRKPPSAESVDLVFPLAGGSYYVVNGGSTSLINAHMMTLSQTRFAAWRGQSYGVDLVALDRLGRRARGVLPRDPAMYAIFGRSVVAPCGGTVVAAVDGLADLPPPRVDREHMAGNHVILDCGSAWVLLGHLQHGSVCVGPGDRVDVGTLIGRVGNTGNSDEPHLHIHAQRPGTSAAPFSGDPLAIRLDGRFLVRNSLIRGRGPA